MVTIIPPPDQARAASLSDHGVLRSSLAMALIAVVLFGLLYPLAGVGLGQLFFPHQANGSLILDGERIVGSSLVAQPFADQRYFISRPSAADHQPMAAGGSNEARSNPEMRQRILAERDALALRDGVPPASVPSDLVTQSGGGFDPHISPASAQIQIERVARARGLETEAVARLVTDHTAQRQFGLLGKPGVNVLMLNLALDELSAPTLTPAYSGGGH